MESFPSSSSYWWERIRTYSRGFVLLFWTYRQSQQTHSYVSTIVILAPESFFVCTCIGVHACIIIYNRLLARHVINRSWESPHSYNISAVRAEMNRVQRVKDKSRQDHTWSDEHFGRHFLTCLWNAWTYFNETYQNYSLSGTHDTGDRSQTAFSITVLSVGSIVTSTIEDRLVAVSFQFHLCYLHFTVAKTALFFICLLSVSSVILLSSRLTTLCGSG